MWILVTKLFLISFRTFIEPISLVTVLFYLSTLESNLLDGRILCKLFRGASKHLTIQIMTA